MSHPPPAPELTKPLALSILQRLWLFLALNSGHSLDSNLTKFAREEYRKLLDRFPEDRFEIELPDSIGIGQENALRLLEQRDYIKTSSGHHGSDGFSYRIDLRCEKFFSEPDKLAMVDSSEREQFAQRPPEPRRCWACSR